MTCSSRCIPTLFAALAVLLSGCALGIPRDCAINVNSVPDTLTDEIGVVYGTTYYVAPDGSDSNPGTAAAPWGSWSKAFREAQAGDLVYFRGGVYNSTIGVGGERGFNSGTARRFIRFVNYPGETPILDCGNRDTGSYSYNRGITLWNAQYIHIKGLHVRNLYQTNTDANVVGVDIEYAGNILLENMTVHDVDGEAYVVADYYGTIKYVNCDAYGMCDWNRSAAASAVGAPGQNGAGFHFRNHSSVAGSRDSKLFYYGCRAWEFSDNGFAGTSVGFVRWSGCWAFDGGRLSGEGCGFKYASTYQGDNNTLPLARVMTNCVGAINGGYGFSPNNAGDRPLVGLYHNNAAYRNGYKELLNGMGYGWRIMDTDTSEATPGEMYSNNLSYGNELSDAHSVHGQPYAHEYNTWDMEGVSLSDGDFLSLDWEELKNQRQEDGSLPDIDFLTPRNGSDLIDAGIDAGLPFQGTAPDLGAFEVAT